MAASFDLSFRQQISGATCCERGGPERVGPRIVTLWIGMPVNKTKCQKLSMLEQRNQECGNRDGKGYPVHPMWFFQFAEQLLHFRRVCWFKIGSTHRYLVSLSGEIHEARDEIDRLNLIDAHGADRKTEKLTCPSNVLHFLRSLAMRQNVIT